MNYTTIYIAVGVLLLLVAIFIYLRWVPAKSEEYAEEEMLPDDSDVDLEEDNEEFTIIDNV